MSLSCVLGGWQEEERVVLELDLVDPLRLNLSLSYLDLKERQGRSIFVMCVNKLPFEESLKVHNELGAVEETLYEC